MFLKRKKRNFWQKKEFLFSLAVWGGLVCFWGQKVQAEEISPSPSLKVDEDTQEAIDDLEKKARNYQKIIDLKKQQQITLQSQLELMQSRKETLAIDVQNKEKEVEEKQKEIEMLEKQIKEKDQEMESSKVKLAEVLRIYDRIDRELAMELLRQKGDVAKILNNAEFLTKTWNKIKEIKEQMNQKKQVLEERKNELEKKQQALMAKKEELEDKVYFLKNEERNKVLILNQTKGEENKYRELLARVEQQKQELIGGYDDFSDELKGELAKIKENAPKPKSGMASTSWYYSQTDSRWGDNRIGLSSSLMKDYGCAITSLAMVFTYHGEKITPGRLATQPIFYRDLIVWPQNWKSLSVQGSTGHGSVSWSNIDKNLEEGNPVIVFVRAAAGKGHYVVVVGKDKKSNNKYVVHDPLFGSNIFLETTQKLVGAIYKSSTRVDQAIVYN